MKHLFLYFAVWCLAFMCYDVQAKDKDAQGPPRSEKEMVERLVASLHDKDSAAHSSLFAKFDDVWRMIVNYRDTSVVGQMQLAQLRQVPGEVRKMDPFFNQKIGDNFNHIIEKGEDSNVHWDKTELVRYELKKMDLTKGLVGYNRIAPLRFQGYIFVRDQFTRKIHGIAVRDIQNINDKWYGGHLIDIYEADTEDKYLAKMRGEIAWIRMLKEQGVDLDSMKAAIDSIQNAEFAHGNDSGDVNTRKEIVERKFYFGLLDDEIPVTMYVQYLRGGCPEKVCEWLAIFKFDDEDEFFKMTVHKQDGKWYFNQEPNVAVMEVEMKGKTFTGNWLAVREGIEYDVYMEEITPKPRTVMTLDDLVDELWYEDQH